VLLDTLRQQLGKGGDEVITTVFSENLGVELTINMIITYINCKYSQDDAQVLGGSTLCELMNYIGS